MLKSKLIMIGFFCLILLFTTGCSTLYTRFSPPVKQDVQVILKENDFKIKQVNIRGEASVAALFSIIPIGDDRLYSRALADLYSKIETQIAGTPSQLVNWTVDEIRYDFIIFNYKKAIFRSDLMQFNK